LNQFVFKKN